MNSFEQASILAGATEAGVRATLTVVERWNSSYNKAALTRSKRATSPILYDHYCFHLIKPGTKGSQNASVLSHA